MEENRLQKHEHEDREKSHHNADSQIKEVESNMTPYKRAVMEPSVIFHREAFKNDNDMEMRRRKMKQR